MNREGIEKDIKFTASIPMLTQEEINEIDMNMNEFINQFTKMVVKEKDLVIAQYIIKRQEEKIKELEQKEAILDQVTEKLKEVVKKERELMPYLPHKSASFHYANGREVLAKEILEFIEGEKK